MPRYAEHPQNGFLCLSNLAVQTLPMSCSVQLVMQMYWADHDLHTSLLHSSFYLRWQLSCQKTLLYVTTAVKFMPTVVAFESSSHHMHIIPRQPLSHASTNLILSYHPYSPVGQTASLTDRRVYEKLPVNLTSHQISLIRIITSGTI